MKLFLDLEGTMIDDLESCAILSANIENIRQFAERNDVVEATIFSFGLMDVADLPIETKLKLETLLGINLIVLTKPQIMAKVLCGVEINEFDFTTIFGKDMAFIHFIRRTEKNGTFVLFDDVVDEGDFNIHSETGLNILFMSAELL